MLGSCGSNESESIRTNESESAASNESESAASNDSTVNVNIREVSTVKIGNLEVMTEDLGYMEWVEAQEACADLGDGWRLPTKGELKVLYKNKDKIGGFDIFFYWSSAPDVYEHAWGMLFEERSLGGGEFLSWLRNGNVRAVRSI